MKYMFVAALMFPLFLSAQDCKLHRDTDPYTKETKLSTGFITLQGGSLSIDADPKEIDFFFTVPGKCFDDNSTLYIFFEGSKSKLLLRNTGTMNCDGDYHYVLRNSANTPSFLERISTTRISQFAFTGNDKKQVIVSLLPDQQDIVMKSAVCMSNEAKTLVKQ